MARGSTSDRAYLALFAIYRDNARYFPEWIEFHRLVGVEHFFLYDNLSADDHLEVLAPYIETGLVVHHDWPMFPGQLQAHDDCIERHGDDARWIGFIDQDEFLFSPTGRPVAEILPDFEEHPAVVVNSLTFGTSGHLTPQPGLLIENYVRRTDRPQRMRVVKSIVDPKRTSEASVTPHHFKYTEGAWAVSETGERVRGDMTENVSHDLLQINHYFTKSQAERNAKLKTRIPYSGAPRPIEGVPERDATLNAIHDDAIAVLYADRVRAALGMPPRARAGERTA
jgi:Glycosyltransferase family 92